MAFFFFFVAVAVAVVKLSLIFSEILPSTVNVLIDILLELVLLRFFKMSHLFSKCSYLIGVNCWIGFSTYASISKVQSCTGCQNTLEKGMGAQLPIAER